MLQSGRTAPSKPLLDVTAAPIPSGAVAAVGSEMLSGELSKEQVQDKIDAGEATTSCNPMQSAHGSDEEAMHHASRGTTLPGGGGLLTGATVGDVAAISILASREDPMWNHLMQREGGHN